MLRIYNTMCIIYRIYNIFSMYNIRKSNDNYIEFQIKCSINYYYLFIYLFIYLLIIIMFIYFCFDFTIFNIIIEF